LLMNRVFLWRIIKIKIDGYDLLHSRWSKESVSPIHIFLMDRLTAMLYPGGSREQYRYDAVGNPVGYTTRAGQIRTSVFDNRELGVRVHFLSNLVASKGSGINY